MGFARAAQSSLQKGSGEKKRKEKKALAPVATCIEGQTQESEHALQKQENMAGQSIHCMLVGAVG